MTPTTLNQPRYFDAPTASHYLSLDRTIWPIYGPGAGSLLTGIMLWPYIYGHVAFLVNIGHSSVG